MKQLRTLNFPVPEDCARDGPRLERGAKGRVREGDLKGVEGGLQMGGEESFLNW